MLAADRLGALLLQFPYRFHCEPANMDYLLRLFENFRQYRLVIEVRHKSFAHDSFFELLTREGVTLANIDLPQVSETMPATRVVTTPELGYLRFHGRNSRAWFAADATREVRYDYDYSEEELERLLDTVRDLQKPQGKLYVIFNNHYRGSQVKNAFEFNHKITGKPVQVMPRLLKTYPELKAIVPPAEAREPLPKPGETLSLFTDL
jgi:uncharacterized protein YecE (DUF72 family)